MNKKTAIVSAFLLTALCFAPVTNADGNNLVQIDVKKTASDSVNVTLFTSDTYNSNVVVTKKADNKYVLIMPNINGKASSPDLSGVKDIVSDVEIRTVTDGGYTKITLTTTKPINIRTNSVKNAPLSAEQVAMKQAINKAQTRTNPSVQPQKVEQPTKTISKKAETKKIDISKQEQKQNILIQKDDKKIVQNTIKEQPKQVKEEKPLEEIKDVVPIFEGKNTTVTEAAIKQIEQAASAETPKKTPSTLPATLLMILLSAAGVILFIRVIKDSLRKSKALKKAFMENISKKSGEAISYNNIINNKDLNWQERYKNYVDESKKTSAPKIKNSRYHATPLKEEEIQKVEEIISQAEAPTVDDTKIEQKRSEFERIMEKHENAEILQSQPKEPIEEPTKVEIEVKNEDVTIPEQLSNSINLKSFKEPVSLGESRRERIQTKLKCFEIVEDLDKRKNVEAKDNIVLGDSLLHTNPRKFPHAALKVSELMEKGNRILSENRINRTMIQDPQDYVMSSVDDFFALMDKEKSEQIPDLVPERLDFSKTRQKQTLQASSEMSNPLLKRTNAVKSTTINGLVIKSGYEIDENKGFYLVNLDGTSALIGRVKEDITVIKKFEGNVENLQVRLDSANTYMVKVGGFRSLVEAGDTKMGVLLEL